MTSSAPDKGIHAMIVVLIRTMGPDGDGEGTNQSSTIGEFHRNLCKDGMDIISAYHQLGSYRTVDTVVEKFEAGDAPMLRAERVHNYDAVTDLVTERVAKSQGQMSTKRILPVARGRRMRRVRMQHPSPRR